MAAEITPITNIFENYWGLLLLLGIILVAIIILKYIQSISKRFSEIK